MLLDNLCCMRVGGLLGGLDIENGGTTTHKRGSAIIRNSHFPTGIMYEGNSNKPNSANQKSSHPDLMGNADFAIQPLVNLYLRKINAFIYEIF